MARRYWSNGQISILIATLLLVSCRSSTVLPAAAAIPNWPTATAALPTATLMPATPAATKEEPIPTTLSQVPRIKPQELKGKLDAGEEMIVVDSRSRASYERRHIPGALSIPLSEIEARRGELAREGEIVFYCTWPAEQTSAGAALKLYQLGFTTGVSTLLGGLGAWEAAGYPVESRWDRDRMNQQVIVYTQICEGLSENVEGIREGLPEAQFEDVKEVKCYG